MSIIKKSIKVGSEQLEYTLNFHAKAKHLKIKVFSDEVKVISPVGVNIKYIEEFVLSKSQWILNHLKCMGEKNLQFFYRGTPIDIEIVENQGEHSICLNSNVLTIKIKNRLSEEHIKELLKKWYINEASKAFHSSLDYHSKIIGVIYNKVAIKEQKTRWGSCSVRGNLNFNWHLIMAPHKILDYIVIHELCHLIHMNHSKHFWDKVEEYMPDYKLAEFWLKENGKHLNLPTTMLNISKEIFVH